MNVIARVILESGLELLDEGEALRYRPTGAHLIDWVDIVAHDGEYRLCVGANLFIEDDEVNRLQAVLGNVWSRVTREFYWCRDQNDRGRLCGRYMTCLSDGIAKDALPEAIARRIATEAFLVSDRIETFLRILYRVKLDPTSEAEVCRRIAMKFGRPEVRGHA